MNKLLLLITILLAFQLNVNAQDQHIIDSLRHKIEVLESSQQKKIQESQEQIQRSSRSSQIGIASGMGGALIGIITIAAIFYWQRNKITAEKKISEEERMKTEAAKKRSDELLLNILPFDVAEELKRTGSAKAKSYPMVAVLFTDFKGFTEVSAKLSAEDLVAEINACFEAFDGIISQHGIEKIKTIGDAYMAAGGLPVSKPDSVQNTVKAALEMQAFIANRKSKHLNENRAYFEMRVGIHSGPVVAGIVGVKKFQYDIWGDTVNTAARMESSGEIGRVNISQTTFELIKDEPEFVFENRGIIDAKGKGGIQMYFAGSSPML